jgi:hypothetical protein
MSDYLVIQLSLRQQKQFDFAPFQAILRYHPSQIRLAYLFKGHDQDPREIYEIPEIRTYMKKLIQQLPELFFYLDQDSADYFGITVACLSDEMEMVKNDKLQHVIAQPKLDSFFLKTMVPRLVLFAEQKQMDVIPITDRLKTFL